MLQSSKDFCFCTLAIRAQYRQLARQLAQDLDRYAPGMPLIVGTDQPQEFMDCQNVLAFRLKSQGILHCFHDKRFVIEQARSYFGGVIMLDADTRLSGQLHRWISLKEGIAAIHLENLVEHVQCYNPERLMHLHRLADKLDLDLAQVQFVGESLFAVVADTTQTTDFLIYWDTIAKYLELHGIHAGEGNAIGLAAAKVGLRITQPEWLVKIDRDRTHLSASQQKTAPHSIRRALRRVRYHKRLNQSRLQAMQDIEFYYR